jgi:hypothetical protein
VRSSGHPDVGVLLQNFVLNKILEIYYGEFKINYYFNLSLKRNEEGSSENKGVFRSA